MFYRPHERVTLDCGDEMITKQEHKDECDIHNILKQYQRTGIITHVQSARATYTDLPDPVDFQESLHTIMIAEEAFGNLPAKVRDHFGNDPGRFLAAFNNPAEYDFLREVGILKPTTPPPPVDPPANTNAPSSSGAGATPPAA